MMKFTAQIVLCLAFVVGFYLFPDGLLKAMLEGFFVGVGIGSIVFAATR